MSSRLLPSSAVDRGSLAVILALALGLRLWGIDFGLPPVLARPDELEVVDRALRLLTGDLNPHFFHYPSLFFYLLGVVYAVWGGAVALLGGSWSGFVASMAADPMPAILVARVVSALLGVLTVYIVYRLGRRVAGELAGQYSALFLAVAHLHVRDSHFATTDVALGLFLAWAVLHILDIAEPEGGSAAGREGAHGAADGGAGDRGAGPYIWAGVFTGLAVSTKYVGLILPAVAAFAHLARHWTSAADRPVAGRIRSALNDRKAWLYPVAALGAFALTTPYALVDPLFRTHFRFQMGHLADGHGLDLGIGGIYHLEHTLPKSLGWPLLLTALVGAGWAKITRPKRGALFFLFPGLFYLSTATGRTVFLRYMLPLIPFLCVGAGWLLGGMRERLGGPRWAWKAVLVALVIVPVADIVATNRLLARTDTRTEAAQWLVDQVGSGTSTVHQTGAHWGWLDLPVSRDSLRARLQIAEGARPVEGLESVREWSVLKARGRLEAAGRVGFTVVAWDSAGTFAGAAPEWVVELRSPLIQYSRVPDPLEALLARDYSLVHRVEAGRGEAEGWYDQHDAFYLPFKRIGTVDRPGPEVRIHRRNAETDAEPEDEQEAR